MMATQTAGVAISGYGTPSKTTQYEQYNGSPWPASPNSVSSEFSSMLSSEPSSSVED